MAKKTHAENTSVMSLRIDDDVADKLDRLVESDRSLKDRGVTTRSGLINDLLREYTNMRQPHQLQIVVDGAVIASEAFTYSPDIETFDGAVSDVLAELVKKRLNAYKYGLTHDEFRDRQDAGLIERDLDYSEYLRYSRVTFCDFLEAHERATRTRNKS